MDHAGGHFLAGTGGAGDQHPAPGRRYPLDRVAQLVYAGRAADQFGLCPGPQPQLGVFLPQPRRFQRTRDNQQQSVGVEWLLDEIIGADLDGPHRRFDGAVATDHDHRHLRLLAVQVLQNPKAIELGVLQPDIEHD